MGGMGFIEVAKLISDEEVSFEFLCGRLGGFCCPGCGCRDFYVMSRRRFRCGKCRDDFRPLGGTWFSCLNLSCSQWLSLVKLFELSVSARKAAEQLSISYNTALRAFDVIRVAIACELAEDDKVLKGEIEADEAYFGGKRRGKRGRGSRNKNIVFGILERNNRVSVSIVRDASAETLMAETVKKVRRGSVVYTDRWKGYDALVFCGYKHLSIEHGKQFSNGKVYINGIEGFWSFAKERMMKYRGVSKDKFLYYIKEMEWRYNNRGKDLFSLLVDYMITKKTLGAELN